LNFSTGEKVEQTNKKEQLTDRREKSKQQKGARSQLKLLHAEFRKDA